MSTVGDVNKYITTSLSCERHLVDKLRPYNVLIWRISYAAHIEIADSVYEFCASLLAGERPEVDVPRRLGLRKIRCGTKDRWISTDPLLHAVGTSAKEDMDGDGAEPIPPKHDADGIDEIMARDRIGRRAAQIRVKKQCDALQRQGDLFIGEVV